jgi:hypothetical protein
MSFTGSAFCLELRGGCYNTAGYGCACSKCSWENLSIASKGVRNVSHRVLSGIFSVLITSESVLLGVYQEFLARHRPAAWSIALSASEYRVQLFFRTAGAEHAISSMSQYHARQILSIVIVSLSA